MYRKTIRAAVCVLLGTITIMSSALSTYAAVPGSASQQTEIGPGIGLPKSGSDTVQETGGIVPETAGTEGTEAAEAGNDQTAEAAQAEAAAAVQAGGFVRQVNANVVLTREGCPQTVSSKGSPDPANLADIVSASGIGAYGGGNVGPDPVLSITPMAYYGIYNVSGVPYIDGTTTNSAEYLYYPGGFQRFKMDHSGVARYYYRTYTASQGWTPWCNSTEMTPCTDPASKVQAIQIRVKGYTYTYNDIYYKVVLNDGTSLDWAYNGQTAGTMGTDRYITAIKVTLWNRSQAFPGQTSRLMMGGAYEGTYLKDGRVLYSTYDGRAHTGWGWWNNKQYYFIDSQPVSGWQYIDGFKYYFNSDGSVCDDLEPVMGRPGSYEIRYNKATRSMYVMAPDGENGYIIPYKTFMSSCGPATPLGEFKTYAKYDWKFMHDDVYCQKLTRFYQGFLMHSLLYYGAPNSYTLDAINYNFIDNAASGGCIRLRACDADWIYRCIPAGTVIRIYEDAMNKGPVEKPAIEYAIPRNQTYDPTDPYITDAAIADAEARAAAAAAQAEAVQAEIAAAAQDDASEGITETE